MYFILLGKDVSFHNSLGSDESLKVMDMTTILGCCNVVHECGRALDTLRVKAFSESLSVLVSRSL